ncbi:MAG: hydrogenase iron-sulfur subunit [Halobacteriota archaeon]|nr:hydrogenase iron-sulfur subunit [Halobacteriota archaeon]
MCIKCGECKAGCNYEAIENDGEYYKIIDISCLNCGKCTVNCPTNAIDLRYYSDSQIEAQIEGILTTDGDSIVAFCCNECSYAAADLAGLSRYGYSSKIKVIRVPCTGRVSSQQIMRSFDLGAIGVIVAGCLEGQCYYTDGNVNAARKVEIAKRILDLIDIGGQRLEMFFMSSAMADKFVEAVLEMEARC